MEFSFYDQEIIKQFISSAFHISWIRLRSVELRRGKGTSVYGLHWFFTPFLSCLYPVTHWGNHGRWMLSGSARRSTSQRLGQLRLEGALRGGGRLWNTQFPWIDLVGEKGLVCLSNLGDVNFYQLGNWTEITTEDNGPETISFFPFFFSETIFWDHHVQPPGSSEGPAPQRGGPAEGELGEMLSTSLSCPLSVNAQVSALRPPVLPLLCSSSAFFGSDSFSHTPSPCVCISHQITRPGS